VQLDALLIRSAVLTPRRGRDTDGAFGFGTLLARRMDFVWQQKRTLWVGPLRTGVLCCGRSNRSKGRSFCLGFRTGHFDLVVTFFDQNRP
jgi:hypothetical protein